MEDRLLESNSSVLVIHDWERHYYKSMVTRSPATTCRYQYLLELQTDLREHYAKFYNHGEGTYYDCEIFA